MVILATTKVDKKFRITIPKEIRELLKLTANSELIFFTVAEWKERVCFRKA
jgi:AbrB family looped-hinge helix DNA binding protein